MWVLECSEESLLVPMVRFADLEAVSLRSASTLKLKSYSITRKLTSKAQDVILRANIAA